MVADNSGRPQICDILEGIGLHTCAYFKEKHAKELDPRRFVEILCNPEHFVHIPLSCLFWDLNIQENDVNGAETEELLNAIDVFRSEKKLPDWMLGGILDHILDCQLRHRTISSIRDLSCLFSLLQTADSQWILDILETSSSSFWVQVFNKWLWSLGSTQWISPTVVDLFRSADISPLRLIFSQVEDLNEFIEDLEQVQASPFYLLDSDWQRILNRRTGEEALSVLHSAVLGRCFLNWLMDSEEEEVYSTDLPMEIVSVLMALVQEKNWRFADISKLFRFSKKLEDLPALLAALTQIHEGNLSSSALDRLPESLKMEEIEGMMENDVEFQPKTEIDRDEAIRRIVHSDFSSYCHESAKVTEELHQMISSFDISYKVGGGEFANEAKAVRAVEEFFKVRLRDVQILGVLLATQARRANVARLLQMQTGEGKTFVIAAIAISEVLNGSKVDIITSSEALAVTQCNELKELYSSVGITVQHNCNNNRADKEKLKIYEADVIYGNASNFMFDVLFEEFWGSKLRCNRGFPLAIVDEVDAQMLDHANHVCQFASSASGMGNLLGIQATVWMLVSQNFQDMKFEDGAWKIPSDDGEVVVQNGGTLKKYFESGLMETVEKAGGFKPGASENEMVAIPESLWEYSRKELPLWINSAVEAFLKKLDFEYCIEDDKIVIVDSSRSGTRNRGIRWSFGLHQFLEMLHATKLSPESLTMCFLSTMSFCRRYKTNIIGLTGTIGGEASRKFLRDVYNVDFVEIPPFMLWRHINLPHIFCDNTEGWLETVVTKAVDKLSQGRACLVITQYIHFAEVLCREIRKRTSGAVGTYTGAGGDMDISGKLAPGTCIVATNVAGRGTDFKISEEVENAGGLHVVLTSLPENDRVERQNIGRSSRTGQRGTSQMILNWMHVDQYFLEEMLRRVGEGASHTVLIDSLKEARDHHVLQSVDVWIKQMAGVQKSDDALTEFIRMRNSLVESFADVGEKIKDEEKTYVQKNIENGLNIRFGIYKATKNSSLDPEEIRREFSDLSEISLDDMERCFCEYVYPVFAAWNHEWDLEKKLEDFERAQKLLGRAIELDPKFAGAAIYVRGYSFLFLYRELENKKYIWEAIEDFKESRAVLERLLEQYKLLMIVTKKKNEAKTKLESQMDRMMTICGVIMGNIDVMIGRDVAHELDKSRRLLNDLQQRGQDVSELEKGIKEMEESREELEKGVLKEIAESGSEIEIKEHRLKEMMPENIDQELFAEDIAYFEHEGYFRLISVKKREKINWWNVVAVSLLGILQIVGGALLAVFTGGAAAGFGVGLMIVRRFHREKKEFKSGAFDIFTAIKSGIIDRDFDWGAYGLEKLFDLTTSVITAGLSGLKNAAKGIAKGVQTMAKVGSSQVAKEALKHGGKQIAKAAIITGTKITANEVFNATVAGPMAEAIGDLLSGEVSKVLKESLQHNGNLHSIVEKDNSHKNRNYTNHFVDRAYDDFVSRVSSKFLDELRKSIGEGVKGNQKQKSHNGMANAVKAGMSISAVAVVVSKVKENLKHLPAILKELDENSNGAGSEKYEARIYEETGALSVDSVINELGSRIARFCAMKGVAKARNFFSSKASNLLVNKTFKKSDKQLAHFKNSFVHSQEVAKRARETKSHDSEDRKVLDHIASVAENTERPGDRLQAKYLAEVTQSPIEIEYKGSDGRRRVVVYGKEFSKNTPIRLKYEQGNGSVGHYFFADGSHATPSGKNTCLFDTVSQMTKYDPKDLKRAAANFMLNDLQKVRQEYQTSSNADLLIGGVRKIGPPVSSSAIKHVEKVDTVDDVLKKAVNTQRNRRGKFKPKENTVVDEDMSDFDDKADAGFRNWMARGARNPTIGPSGQVQCDYFHDETNIYAVEFSPRRRRNPIAIHAYRGEAAFNVENVDGAVHHAHQNTRQTSGKVTIWRQGDQTDTYLNDLFVHHPNYQNLYFPDPEGLFK